jgi:hypothetical protein
MSRVFWEKATKSFGVLQQKRASILLMTELTGHLNRAISACVVALCVCDGLG